MRTRRAALRQLEQRQRRWARDRRLEVDARGFTRSVEANLWLTLDDGLRTQLERGSELQPRRSSPPRIRCLWSSAAIVANVFAYWRDRDTTALARALGFAPEPMTLSFEEPLATGLSGEPPTTDVLLTWPSGRVAAIESKFSEWLKSRPRNKAVFKPKYFPPAREIWTSAGLPRCQALAADLQNDRERFRWLNAPQLLKHALGLALSARPFELVYLFYDWPGRESEAHREEIGRFAARTAGELTLRVLTYQEIFSALQTQRPRPLEDYLEYLSTRYFPRR